jgi:hypothetical protein
MMGSNRSRIVGALTCTLAIPLAITVATDSRAAGRGQCTSAHVGEELQLPDGSVHPPGRITLCVRQRYSPVSSLHTVHVDGMPVALLASRRGRGEGESVESPFFILLRDGRGRLHLAGYATPARDRMVTYELVDLRPARHARTVAGLAPGGPSGAGAPTLMLAARVD